jgi:hypothetical protein
VDRPATLPRAPGDALGPTGAPRLGAYQGSLGKVDLSPLAPPGLLASVRHAAREKRWQRVVLGTATHVVSVGILDAGSLAGGGVWVADRATGEVVFDRAAGGVTGLSARVGARPGPGARAAFAAPGMELMLERRSDRFQLTADLGSSLALEAFLDARGAPEPFSLVAPLPGAGPRAAQVTGPLAVQGVLSVRGRRTALDGGLAVLTFGAGLFPRECAWRAASAAGRLPDGRPVALHLAEGLPGLEEGDGGEDVLLLGRGPLRLPPVAFQAEPRSPTAPWRLVSRDGAVDLVFRPVASHREARELLLVSLQTTQLAGALSGHLPGPDGRPLEVDGLAAVVEDLAARW